MYITNALIFMEDECFRRGTLRTDGDVIAEIITDTSAPLDSAETVIDASGCYCIPGLTDIHFHGCNGADFCDGTVEAYRKMAQFELRCGVTSICPATMTLPPDTLSHICTTAASFRRQQQADGADLIGIHMEGPFINAARKGAQNEAYIQKADSALLSAWIDSSAQLVRLVTLAPETEGALSCIEALRDRVAFSIGHTDAGYDTAMAAFAAGADHVTHLYNAMPPFHHRSSGVIGAAYDNDGCYVELICDGIHVSAPVVRSTFKLCQHRVVLISDSMRATGMPDGVYTLGGQDVTVHGNLALLADNTIAGSATALPDCMRTAVRMGVPLEQAISAATINPCRSIRQEAHYGSISLGKKAHLLLLERDTLALRHVIKGSLIL